MLRKLRVILLSVTICLMGAIPVLAQGWSTLQEYKKDTGKRIEEFNQAPALRVQVAAGELPAVEERLPEEPYVMEPVEEIGQYGGVVRQQMIQAYSRGQSSWTLAENLVRFSSDRTEILPNVAKSWQWSEDRKSITFYLRKGMKWSDGYPFTADDFMFYWNDIMLNKELNPSPWRNFVIAGEPGKIEKIDDYAFKLTFIEIPSLFLRNLVVDNKIEVYAPKHYLERFHPKYTQMDEIEKIMEREGFDTWVNLFLNKGGDYEKYNNPEYPQTHAWTAQNTDDKPMQIFVRNPYYWKVDTEGNQLPYIDEWRRTFVSDLEAIVLKTIAGEYDYGNSLKQNMEVYPVLMKYREEGDYRVLQRDAPGANTGAIHFNYWHEDPVIRKLFRDKQFRIALSVAIDRDEINMLLYNGLGTPSQAFPPPGMPWYEERFVNQYIEYDPKRANEILDELGLTWDEKHEYRLRSDGKRLQFVTVNRGWPPEAPEIMDILRRKYWKAIGIEIVPKIISKSLWKSLALASDFDIVVEAQDRGFLAYPPVTRDSVMPRRRGFASGSWATNYVLWFDSEGEEGEEPPADVKRLREIYEEIYQEVSEEKRLKLTMEALTIHYENFWDIGMLRPPDVLIFTIAKNNLRNVPETNWGLRASDSASQFFIRK